MRQPNYERDYPVREHLPDSITTADWLEEELRTSGSGMMMRENVLMGLGGLYKETELDQSLRVHARSLDYAYALVSHDEESEVRFRTEAFYSGALLGMHAELSTKTLKVRKEILNRWDGNKEMMRSRTAEFMEQDSTLMMVASGAFHERMQQYPEDLRTAIITAASTLYIDLPDGPATDGYQWTSMFGSVYAIDTIRSIERTLG